MLVEKCRTVCTNLSIIEPNTEYCYNLVIIIEAWSIQYLAHCLRGCIRKGVDVSLNKDVHFPLLNLSTKQHHTYTNCNSSRILVTIIELFIALLHYGTRYE